MTKTIRTLQDARNEKNAMDARLFSKMDAREAAQKEVAAVLAANPQIGTLIRNGKPVYYSFANGYRESRDPKALA